MKKQKKQKSEEKEKKKWNGFGNKKLDGPDRPST